MEQQNRLVDQSLITKPSLPQYPIIFRDPTFKQSRSNFRASDYALALGAPTAISSYIYYSNYLSSRAVATWAVVLYPACYILSAKRVANRLQGISENERECKNNGVEFIRTKTPYNI